MEYNFIITLYTWKYFPVLFLLRSYRRLVNLKLVDFFFCHIFNKTTISGKNLKQSEIACMSEKAKNTMGNNNPVYIYSLNLARQWTNPSLHIHVHVVWKLILHVVKLSICWNAKLVNYICKHKWKNVLVVHVIKLPLLQ